MRSDRLLATLLLLQTHGRLPAPELARRLEVSTRTVARDVEALSSAGVPVYAERGRHGGVVLLPGFRTDVSGLTDGEMRALLALTDGEQGGSLGRAVASAVRKLLAAVPETRRPGIDRARRTVVVEPQGWHRAGQSAGNDPALLELERAVAADERVRIRYRPASGDGDASWRTVDPYGLVSKAGTWYLIAAARGTARMYRASRVEEVAATGTPARRPDDRDLEQVWIELRDRLEEAPEAVTVRVRVDPARRAMVERVVAAQLVGPPEDGGPDVVHLPFRAAGAAVGILLGFGAVLEVLGPPEVRALMVERATEVVGLYG